MVGDGVAWLGECFGHYLVPCVLWLGFEIWRVSERWVVGVNGRVVVQPGWSCVVWNRVEGGCIGAGPGMSL